jgi:hypothetical protein
MAGIENHVAAGKVQTGLVPPDLALLAEHPVLVAALVVTGPQAHRLVQVLALRRRVHALAGPGVTNLSGGDRLTGNKELGIDVVQVPLEALALEVLAQFLPARHIAVVPKIMTDAVVVVLLEVVEPDLRQPDGVAAEDVDAGAPLVRRPLAEDVSDVGAGDNLQGAAAHPGLPTQSYGLHYVTDIGGLPTTNPQLVVF